MEEVTLHVYDLSNGLAAQFSPALLGKSIAAIYHTGIVAFSREHYFGGGICASPPASTPYGSPIDTIVLGTTAKSHAAFTAFLADITPRFTAATYDLLENNCNNFTDAAAHFLLGAGIPQYILDLPREALDTPLGAALRPMLDSMQTSVRDASAGHELLVPPPPPRLSAISACAKEPFILAAANVAPILAKARVFDERLTASPPGVDDLLASIARLKPTRAFPALDLLRIALASSPSSAATRALPGLLARFLDASAPDAAAFMCLRVAVNILAHTPTLPLTGDLVEAVAAGLLRPGRPARTAAMLGCNIAGARRRGGKVLGEDEAVRLVCAVVERAGNGGWVDGVEAHALVGCVGVLVVDDVDSRELVRTLDLDLAPFIDPERCPSAKARNVAMELDAILRH